MGSSESKQAACQAVKPEPAVKKSQASRLVDPRSPSTGIDRTPIQVDSLVSKTSADLKSECLPALSDPRSPSIGITRTPVREVMRATVGSFARRLGMILHLEAESKSTDQKCTHDHVEEEEEEEEEQASTDPLLTPQLPNNYDSLAEHAKLLATPVTPLLESVDNQSPFVLVEEPQVEVEIETEGDLSLDDAEEATEPPLHKRLSMSLIAYHDGATSSHIFAEVHRESGASPEPSVDVELLGDGVDHCYARSSLTVEAEEPAELSVATSSPAEEPPVQPEEAQKPSPEVPEEKHGEESSPSESQTAPSLNQPQVSTGIRCPSFDSKSPSQAVFKPQWLGKGFGATGMRAKGVQGHRGKGGSSPLAVRVAVKTVTSENKRHSGKLKQKATQGRSPLQILKDTNSPREQRSQTKLKVSTPDKQRLGQMDRRVLAVSLDKENR